MTVSDQLRQFIISELTWHGSGEELTDDFPLLDNSVIDSLGIFEIVSFIEEQYGVEIPDEEFVYDNFKDINAIARLVASRTSATEVAAAEAEVAADTGISSR